MSKTPTQETERLLDSEHDSYTSLNQVTEPTEDDDISIFKIPNFIAIEACCFTNVFLSGFDGTVTASTYTTIGNHFHAANMASWITTSYLITSTAFQPLYGSVSDVIGRRRCVLFATTTFSIGCLGCSIAPNMFILNLMRALTGVGAGGLITLSTIINSDMIPTRKRGLVQAGQNIFLGIGAVCGASLGGFIAQTVGWRGCFLAQIPPCIWSIYVGYNYVVNQKNFQEPGSSWAVLLKKIDIRGSVVLVAALTIQLLVLTLGGNELPWLDWRLYFLGFIGVALTGYFIYVETHTTARPIIPIKQYHNWFTIFMIGLNFIIGLSAYAYLFALPQLFQIVLQDSASKAGLRLMVPSLSTPLGGVTTGVLMNKFRLLRSLVVVGTTIMTTGNFLALLIRRNTPTWLVSLLLVPANLGQGLSYPSSLFTFIFAYGPKHHATSTSTTYLMRSIGGVWGVSGVGAIIQAVLKLSVERDLGENTDLSHSEIKHIVKKILQSTDNIFSLPDNIKNIVLADYERGIRLAQFTSSVLCATAVVFIVCASLTRSRPDPRHL